MNVAAVSKFDRWSLLSSSSLLKEFFLQLAIGVPWWRDKRFGYYQKIEGAQILPLSNAGLFETIGWYATIAGGIWDIFWKDAAIRLAYFSTLDNLIHVVSLRWYYHTNALYTTYLNNSEILTVIMWMEMALWTWYRASCCDKDGFEF